ncbi:MAG: hypothetical protein NTZ98_15285 [Acidobacteria bacterium]|jgi:hypothetical protein|nr:hypothetical protein [Acidobacteriota bacterium]
MRISTVREFRDNATGFLRSRDPILVTRRGRLAGVFFPWPEASLPMELKRELFSVLSAEVRRQIKKRGLTEEEVVADFESWRKDRRETGRRR